MFTPRTILQRLSDHLEAREWPLTALLALCIGRLWLVPLPSSFWVDELVTAFVVHHPGHASFAVAPQVEQSIYYWLPRAADALFGFSEIAWRIPSVLAMGVALWLIARLAARLIHPRAGWFAVFAALSLRGIDYQAIDARPYGLGMTLAAATLLFLVRWMDSARWRDAVLFVFFAALVWRVHLLFWPFYIVIAIYALTRLCRRDTAASPANCALVAVALGICLTPSAISALTLSRGGHAHAFADPATLRDLLHQLHWNVPVLCGAGAWLLRDRRKSSRQGADSSAIVLLLAWWLVQPVCLYLYSRLTGNSVYVSRYLSLMLPGAALSATMLTARWLPVARFNSAAAFMALAALATQGHWETAMPRHDISDWRTAAHEVNRFAPDSQVPVLIPSPFVEARPPFWTPAYPLPGFLYAQLDGYPITGLPRLLPFEDDAGSPEGIAYATSLAEGELSHVGKWAIYGGARGVRNWRKWFADRPEFASWRAKLLEFGDVYVAEFTSERLSKPQP